MDGIESLGKLHRYLPFIDFLLSRGEKDERLPQIQKWIRKKTNVQKGVADKTYGLLCLHYRRLHIDKLKRPKWVDVLFNNTTKYESIDLCNDDYDSDVQLIENNECTDNSIQNECDTQLFDRRCPKEEKNNSIGDSNSNDTGIQLPAICKTSPKSQSVVEEHEKIFLSVFENILDDKETECKLYSKEEHLPNGPNGAEEQNIAYTERLARIYDDFTAQTLTNNINLNNTYQNQGSYPNVIFPSTSNGSSGSTNCLRVNTNDPRIKSSGQSKIYGPHQQEMPQMLSPPNTSRGVCNMFQTTGECRPKPKSITYGEYKRQKLSGASQSKLNNHSNADIEIHPNNRNQMQALINTDSTKAPLHPEIVKETQINNSNKTDNKLDRVFKQLQMDLTGYNQLQDFMCPIGKRRSSVNASSAIALQLNIFDAQRDDDQAVCNKKSKILKRRKSMSEKKSHFRDESHMCDVPSTIGKRRLSFHSSNQIYNKDCNPDMNNVKNEKPKQNSSEKNSNMSEVVVTPRPLSKRRASINATNAISMQLNRNVVNALKDQKQNDCVVQDIPKPLPKIRANDSTKQRAILNNDLLDPPKASLSINEFAHGMEPLAIQPSTSKCNGMKQKIKQNSKKNIDSNMTEQNTKMCVLCPSKPHNLTNHYVGRHKTESYVSRLPLKKLLKLQIDIPYASCVSINNFTKYIVKCIFCGEIITNEFLKLYDHFATHTGEYAYKCGGCGLQKPVSIEISAHKHKSKKCFKKKTLTLYSYNPYQMVIEIFWCKICNFVQLNAANVGKHIMEQHDRNANSYDIERLVVVAIQNEPNVANEPITEDDNMNEMTALNETYDPGYDSMNIKPIITTDNSILSASVVDLNERVLENYFDIENVKRELDVTIDNHFIENEKFEKEADVINPDFNNFTDFEFGDETDIDYGYKPIPEGTSYYSLFKCMGAECFYSTDVDIEFINHIKDHKDSHCSEVDILYCAYCNNDLNEKYVSAEDLIAHIKENHENSVFHCNYCCYRSCVPGNVLIHHEVNHGSSLDAIVIECGIKQNIKNHNSYLLNQLKTNVDELLCKYCPATFYAVSSIASHIENTHGVEVNPIEFKSYSCVYCFENFFEFGNVELHLANKHPNEEPYICQRELRKPVEVESVCDLVCKPISKYVPKDKIISWPDQNLNKNNEEIITNEDSTKSLLYELTQNTGVPPDHLYLCPNTNCRGIFSTYDLWFQHITRRHGSTAVSCPFSQHCKKFQLMDLAEFKSHFPSHCLHQYVCFQCGNTFRYDCIIYEHCFRTHNNAKEEMRFEKITINERFCYYIVVQKNMCIDEKSFNMDLQNVINKRLMDLANKRNLEIVSYWRVPLSAKWIEAFPKYANITETSNCKIKSCTFVGNSIDTFKHIKLKHRKDIGQDITYGCNICKDYEAKVDDNSVDSIENHIKMHEDNLYICCLCLYYHYSQHNMSGHCYKVHNHLDVPIVHLIRSNTIIYMSLSIVFGLEQTTFSTIQACFCCNLNLNDLKQSSYAKHLTTDHKLNLEYACEYCNKTIECLSKSQQHFAEHHTQQKLKINVKFSSFCEQDLVVESLDPLAVRIASNLLDYSRLAANIKQEI